MRSAVPLATASSRRCSSAWNSGSSVASSMSCCFVSSPRLSQSRSAIWSRSASGSWSSCSSNFVAVSLIAFLRMCSQCRADGPRGELLLADAGDLALGLLAACDCQDLLEDLVAHRFHRHAFEYLPGVDVHVPDHVVVKRCVGRHLDPRGRLAAEDAATAG